MIDHKLCKRDIPSAEDPLDYPRATPAEKLKGGMRLADMHGRWPGDVNDGFEEFVLRLRRGEY